LNLAFLGTPVISILLPSFTKDVVVIWWANFAVTAIAYAYAYLKPESEDDGSSSSDEEESQGNSGVKSLLIKAFKALDYGSGQERGARK
jgi:hypothetical protein